MERKTADEYPQELLDLFHEYQHGDMDRRSFMNSIAKFAVGGLTVAAIFDSLTPNYAWAQTIKPDDPEIKVGYETVRRQKAMARSRATSRVPQEGGLCLPCL